MLRSECGQLLCPVLAAPSLPLSRRAPYARLGISPGLEMSPTCSRHHAPACRAESRLPSTMAHTRAQGRAWRFLAHSSVNKTSEICNDKHLHTGRMKRPLSRWPSLHVPCARGRGASPPWCGVWHLPAPPTQTSPPQADTGPRPPTGLLQAGDHRLHRPCPFPRGSVTATGFRAQISLTRFRASLSFQQN